MSVPAGPALQPMPLLYLARRHWRLLAGPTVVCTLVALLYAGVRERQWEASQALLVRDAAGATLNRQGRFDSNEAMKTAQETIAEICRNPAVVGAALAAVGPPEGTGKEDWPTQDAIDEAGRSFRLTAPKGQEFGRSEVVYLSVKAGSRDRAIALTRAICDELESRLKLIRDRKAQSVVAELEKAVAVAQRDLAEVTRELAALESDVGSDLGELRILNDSGAGDSNLRAIHTQVRNELRQVRLAMKSTEEQLRLLQAAQKSPDTLAAAPKGLLDSHPSLRRLKDGLVDAQLRTAQLMGKMNADHPEVRAAAAAEAAIRRQLSDELTLAIGSLEADLQVSQSQVQTLERQQADVDQRLNRLAAMRASYANLVARSRQCSETLQRAEKDLADARATQAAAQSASLITRLDGPTAGDNPVDPSTATVLCSGVVGGFVIGAALVFLVSPGTVLRGRRWTDFLPRGRRATDRMAFGRRATDQAAQPPVPGLPPGGDRRSGSDRRGNPAATPDGRNT